MDDEGQFGEFELGFEEFKGFLRGLEEEEEGAIVMEEERR